MGAAEIIAEVEAAGIELSVDGDRLLFDAPAGAMTPEVVGRLRKHKAEIVELLRESAANHQSVPSDGAAFEAMRRDLDTVVEDLLEVGEPRGKVRRMFGLSWAELGRGRDQAAASNAKPYARSKRLSGHRISVP